MSSTETRVRVWDIGVRLFHWSLAGLILGAYLTAEEDATVGLHARLGLAVLAWVIFRVVWGLVGPAPARFRTFVRSPREVLAYARDYVRGQPGLHLSHNPLGGVMVVSLLALLLALTGSGLLMYLGPEWSGPLSPYMGRSLAHGVEELHEGLAGALPVLVVLHVAGVLLSSRLERQNLVLSMITGRKRAPDATPPARARAPAVVVAAGLGLATFIGLGLLLPGRADAAETPQALLQSYQRQAEAEGSGFAGFDPARGKALFLKETSGADPSSCAGCHGADPTRAGRSPAGRNIEPLAPSAQPERFTDAAKADKWFKRNCKQLLRRDCTATERGDVLAWLLTL
ncbi:MAG: DUF1924 domain-containing protein [Myxococcales bacterium]|nr:DUF1924 domain-containing protein [Myxococcales bacterium]